MVFALTRHSISVADVARLRAFPFRKGDGLRGCLQIEPKARFDVAEASSRSFATDHLKQILRLEASATNGVGMLPTFEDALLGIAHSQPVEL